MANPPRNVRIAFDRNEISILFDLDCVNCGLTRLNESQKIASASGNLIYTCPCGANYRIPYELTLLFGEAERFSPVNEVTSLAKHLKRN